jgi:hypothetical protein
MWRVAAELFARPRHYIKTLVKETTNMANTEKKNSAPRARRTAKNNPTSGETVTETSAPVVTETSGDQLAPVVSGETVTTSDAPPVVAETVTETSGDQISDGETVTETGAPLSAEEANASLLATVQSIGETAMSETFDALMIRYLAERDITRGKCAAAGADFIESDFWADDSIAARVCAAGYLVPDMDSATGAQRRKKNGELAFRVDSFRRRIVALAEPAIRNGIRTRDAFKLAIARHKGSVASFARECASFGSVHTLVSQLVNCGLLQTSKRQKAHAIIMGKFGTDAGATGARVAVLEFSYGAPLTTAQVATFDKAHGDYRKAARLARVTKGTAAQTSAPAKLTWAVVLADGAPVVSGETATSGETVTETSAPVVTETVTTSDAPAPLANAA